MSYKYSEDDVKTWLLFYQEGWTQKEIADAYMASSGHVSTVLNGKGRGRDTGLEKGGVWVVASRERLRHAPERG